MDVTTLRISVTLISLIVFIAICVWAWSARNTADFEAAAQLPFDPVPEAELKKNEN